MALAIDIRVENLCKTYVSGKTSVVALENVSFDVERGSLLCIVGPSGCGKTTLLRILASLESPSAGKIWLDPEQVRGGIAYVEQSPSLLPWRTLLQNAALGVELKGRIEKASVRYLEKEIRDFGMAGFETSLPFQLSGGMCQRVALIRAVGSRPRILLCDEPFSAVDFVARLELNTRFKYMCKVEGITTVFVTHNIEEAIFLGDKIVVMSGRPGRVVSRHTPHLSIGSEDAVRCRASPEFSELLNLIWKELKVAHQGAT